MQPDISRFHKIAFHKIAWMAAIALSVCAAALPATAYASEIAPLKRLLINAPTTDQLKQMLAEEDRWADARASVGSLLLVEGNFKKFSDDELEQFVKQIRGWNISLEVEVGAIKQWSHEGEKSFAIQKSWWDRIARHGGDIHAFAMDGPRENALRTLHLSEDLAVDQVARFVTAVHQAYPQALVGDVEPYPASATEDHIQWIDRLEQRLHDAGGRGLDFYRTDVNWVAFKGGRQGSWAGLKAIEQHCHASNIKFSLVYWASDYPLAKAAGRLGDKTWYDGIMAQGSACAAIGAAPDQYVVESWIGLPRQALPDSDGFTFTQSVRDFARKFVR
jgi:hypothetical protein